MCYSDQFNNVSFPKLALDSRYLLVSATDYIDIYDASTIATDLTKMRQMPVQELIVDLHLDKRGLAFSCYKSVHIWDFWNNDNSTSLFCGTKTHF